MENMSVYASREEIMAFALRESLVFSEVRRAQVYALYEMEGLNRADICAVTGYKPSTVSTMRYKMENFATLAEMVFGNAPAEPLVHKNRDPDPSTAIRVAVRRFKDGRSVQMNYLPECGEDVKGQHTAYLFKFYGEDRTAPLFTKIGTTERTVNERLRQEIGEYAKNFPIQSVDICKIVDCGAMPPEGCESYLRCMLMKDYPGTWKKNDRFFNADVDTERFMELCQAFNGM